jgi:hypothetical protein
LKLVSSCCNTHSTNGKSQEHRPIAAEGHNHSTDALAMYAAETLPVRGGTEKVLQSSSFRMAFFGNFDIFLYKSTSLI